MNRQSLVNFLHGLERDLIYFLAHLFCYVLSCCVVKNCETRMRQFLKPTRSSRLVHSGLHLYFPTGDGQRFTVML